jgi:hypothetical protein
VRNRALRGLTLALAVSVLAAAVYWAGPRLAAKGLDWADKASSVASAVLAAVAVVLAGLSQLRRLVSRRPVSDQDLRQARDDLAAELGRRWADEERLRRIHNPRPLPIRWEVTASARAATPGRTPDPVAGRYPDVHAFFLGLPARRAVFLGTAGAGKSVLVVKLARDLVATRDPGDPVPVILPIGEWDPRLDLAQWMADQLVRSYADLAERVRFATGQTGRLAELLVAGGGVMPVLDGLDELPEALRGTAIEQINDMGSDLPLVVTSRPEEYLGAVDRARRGLAGAAVVELRPLRVSEAEAYLLEATAAIPAGRWDTVRARLAGEPDGPLAEALTTPLLLALARTIYDDSATAPAELTDRTRFPDFAAVENHLLEMFIPAVYAGRATNRWVPAGPRYSAAQATRWLAFLAAYLQRTGTQELAWWRLLPALRGAAGLGIALRGLLLAGVARVLLLWVLDGYGGWADGRYDAAVAWQDALLGGPVGQWLSSALDPPMKVLLEQLSPMVWSLLQVVLSPGFAAAAVGTAEVWALVALAVPSLLNGMVAEVRPKTLRLAPHFTLRWLVTNVLNRAIVLCSGPVVYLLITRPSHLDLAALVRSRTSQCLLLLAVVLGVVGLPRSLVTGADLPGVRPQPGDPARPGQLTPVLQRSPEQTLRFDRRADLVSTVLRRLIFGSALALVVGARLAAAYALFAAAATLIAVLLGGTSPSNRAYRHAHQWLFLGRRLPWRAMSFLADAHRREVLRRTGAVYHFRHIRLQEHLAARHARGYEERRSPVARAWTARVSRFLADRSQPLLDRLPPFVPRLFATAVRDVRQYRRLYAEREAKRRQERDASSARWRWRTRRLRPGGVPVVSGYRDIDELLDRLRNRLAALLGPDLVALYLHGSLATGDFDARDGDIDLLAVTRTGVDEALRDSVGRAVEQLATGYPTRAHRVDLEWVRVDDLAAGRTATAPTTAEPLTFACAPVLLRFALRDRGRAVLGPPPRALVPEVGLSEYVEACHEHLRTLAGLDWDGTSGQQRLAAVRIVYRGVRACRQGTFRSVADSLLLASMPEELRAYGGVFSGAFQRREVAPPPELLTRLLTAAVPESDPAQAGA